MSKENDLDAIASKWLRPCGSCDGGLPTVCTHPTEDYRPVMSRLVEEVSTLRKHTADLDEVFGRMYDRCQEATRAWQAEDPVVRHNVMPDIGHLIEWLLSFQKGDKS